MIGEVRQSMAANPSEGRCNGSSSSSLLFTCCSHKARVDATLQTVLSIALHTSKFTDFQDSLVHIGPSSDRYMDDDTLGKLLAEVHRDYADYRCPEGVSVSPSSMSVMVDRTGEPVERSEIDHFGLSETCVVLKISFL